MVESQVQVATTAIVDSAEEQAVLEALLDQGKPPLRPGTERLDYLLRTPFRYPPLAHGSRFGSRFEPSIFYGSLGYQAVLAECAYYRFVFWTGMARPPPGRRLVSQHTSFQASYRTRRGIRLQDPPFSAFASELSSPASYAETQALGTEMRHKGTEAVEYVSARDPDHGINVALFQPAALAPPCRATDLKAWTCTTTAERVAFLALADRSVKEFPLTDFLLAGNFPAPAA
jgi:hypothetical protein